MDVQQFNRHIGEKLRLARRMRDLSLQDVARLSEGEFKSSVLGAYERGERSLSVQRLTRLAELLEVPVTVLIPGPSESFRRTVQLDLAAAEQLDQQQAEVMERFLKTIQVMRKGNPSNELAVRSSDIEVLASIIQDRSGSTEGIELS